MKNTVIIKKNYEFKNLFSKGKFFYGEFINFYIKTSEAKKNRLGIAVSSKKGKAVQRNRLKRLIRENYKEIENRIQLGTQILIIVNKKKELKEITFYNIKEDFYIVACNSFHCIFICQSERIIKQMDITSCNIASLSANT